jgi:hypothetical protein
VSELVALANRLRVPPKRGARAPAGSIVSVARGRGIDVI